MAKHTWQPCSETAYVFLICPDRLLLNLPSLLFLLVRTTTSTSVRHLHFVSLRGVEGREEERKEGRKVGNGTNHPRDKGLSLKKRKREERRKTWRGGRGPPNLRENEGEKRAVCLSGPVFSGKVLCVLILALPFSHFKNCLVGTTYY